MSVAPPDADADLAAILAFAESECEALGAIIDRCCNHFGDGMAPADIEQTWCEEVMRFLSEGPAEPRMFEFTARAVRLSVAGAMDRMHRELLTIGARSSTHAAHRLAAAFPAGSA